MQSLAFSRHESMSGVPGISLRAFHSLSRSLCIFVFDPSDDNFIDFMLKKHVLTGEKRNTVEEVRSKVNVYLVPAPEGKRC